MARVAAKALSPAWVVSAGLAVAAAGLGLTPLPGCTPEQEAAFDRWLYEPPGGAPPREDFTRFEAWDLSDPFERGAAAREPYRPEPTLADDLDRLVERLFSPTAKGPPARDADPNDPATRPATRPAGT